MNEWMNEWINEWMNEWMNECLTTPQHEKQIGYWVLFSQNAGQWYKHPAAAWLVRDQTLSETKTCLSRYLYSFKPV